MGQDFFKFLPSEIIQNILSRLPTGTIMSCKCVCKPWLNLLTTPEFVKSHLSKFASRLAIFDLDNLSKPYKIVELVDEHRWSTILNIDLPLKVELHSSANGVLFLGGYILDPLILCNPITREYITLPSPRRPNSKFEDEGFSLETYGFGVSRMSREYKVVQIFYENKPPYGCQVYTVGTGSWRKIATGKLANVRNAKGAFLNGNLHWLANEGSSRRISCFDLEAELFESFSVPPPLYDYDNLVLSFNKDVSVLGDCLCVCNSTIDGMGNFAFEIWNHVIEIWLMKEYGDEESWTKDFIIRKSRSLDDFLGNVFAIKVFEDGDIVIELGGRGLLRYDSKTKRTRDVYSFETLRKVSCYAAPYAPSFLPLNTFAKENVSSF